MTTPSVCSEIIQNPPKIRKEFHFCTFLRWRGLDEPQPMVCLPVTEAAREQDDLSMWCNSAQQGPNRDSVMLTMIITDMMMMLMMMMRTEEGYDDNHHQGMDCHCSALHLRQRDQPHLR